MLNSVVALFFLAYSGGSFQVGPAKNLLILHKTLEKYTSLGAELWGDFEGFKGSEVLGPTIFQHLGDQGSTPVKTQGDSQKHAAYNLNVGKALETLRRELPFVFALSNLDYSIFAPSITVSDGSGNKMVMPKNLYSAAVKSVQMAASFSSSYPSMNVLKIEFIEDSGIIQCLVDVTLPDTVRVDGQAVWEGMFYFGLDENGLISTHIFDRKISNMRPKIQPAKQTVFPWLRQRPIWSSDLLAGVSFSESQDYIRTQTSDIDNISG